MQRGIMPGGIEEVAVEELDLRFESLRLHSPSQVARLEASMKREGIRQPVLAATEVEPGRRVLVDGFKRVRVARELQISRLAVSLLPLDAPAALAAMLCSNAAHQGLTALEEGWIAHTMCRDYGLTQASAGALLGHEQSWVCRRLRLVEQLDDQLKDDLRLGLLPPAVAQELVRLPVSQQEPTAQVIREHGLSSRQVAQLLQKLLATDDPRVRSELLADPLRTIALAPDQAPAKPSADPRLSAGANDVRRSLLSWEGAAWRLARSLMTHAPTGFRAQDRRLLAPTVRQALAAGRRTLERLEQVVAPTERPDAT
jgi:ParB-like chromosome segregation protein Spo0J